MLIPIDLDPPKRVLHLTLIFAIDLSKMKLGFKLIFQ